MPFTFQSLALADVKLAIPKCFRDERGGFWETYKSTDFTAAGIREVFVQDNQSFSKKGVTRGLHFQKAPHVQAKLVQALSGTIFDVVVDLRPQSPSYGRWLSVTLRGDEPNLLYVPEGFAHGFQVLSDSATVLYKCSTLYCPAAEGGIRWNDPTLNISWPISDPILSPKDAVLPLFESLSGP